MKYDRCPKCDSNDLGDRWSPHRMLGQYCHECGWKGEVRIPEQEPIESSRRVQVNVFPGFHFTVYDKYGQAMHLSKSYPNETEAFIEMERQLVRGEKDTDAGPYTGVLWPATVVVLGTVYKSVEGKARKA